jgi:hypothetical protein
VERLSRAEFAQLSADEQSERVQETLAALRESIPHRGADVGAFLDVASTSKSSSSGRQGTLNGSGRCLAPR